MTVQEQILSQIDKLSINERLLIVESIWDSILSAQGNIEVSDHQKDTLDKRYNDYRDNPEDNSSWDEVKRRIQKQL
jgi:putative addiction module component (TIGR02574 family)